MNSDEIPSKDLEAINGESNLPSGQRGAEPDILPAGPSDNLEDIHLVEPASPLPPLGVSNLSPLLRAAVTRAGWTELTPVQARGIPYLQARRDLMIQSRTGTGKTGAYLLPLLERIDPQINACQVLVLVPTRELACQVTRDAGVIFGENGPRVVAVYGGVGYGPQIEGFRAGAHFVVGTPGRILDHLLRGTLKLDRLEVLILDEADRMLSMGFYPDMKQVQRFLPSRWVNTYMFSATYPFTVTRLAAEFLRQPDFLSLSRDHLHVTEADHYFCVVPAMNKDRALVRLIEQENPESALIFCNTKSRVHYVSVVLQRFGYDTDELSADLSQVAREKVMSRLRRGELRFLVATDLAGRGIDIPELSHVFLYDTPEDPEVYIHRAGRTGRAGAGGVIISLVAGLEEFDLKRIARSFKIDIQPRPLPTAEDVEALVAERTTALLESKLRVRDKLEVERMQRFLPLARSLGQCEEEMPLIAMLLDDFYQQTLHALPPQPAGEQPAPPPRPSRRKQDQNRRRRR